MTELLVFGLITLVALGALLAASTYGSSDARLRRAVVKVHGKNRVLKARVQELEQQVDAIAELNVMIRSELTANIHASQLRGARSAMGVAEIEQVMPNGGKAMIYEDEQEQQGRKQKRYGTKG